ncbi:MAG: hypothetical protein ABSH01_27910 [Terriglobia bacterium]|jgi:hypothetical protein
MKSRAAAFGVRLAGAGCRFPSAEACFRQQIEQARADAVALTPHRGVSPMGKQENADLAKWRRFHIAKMWRQFYIVPT